MSEIVDVLKDMAAKIGRALGHDASKAEHRLMHDTGDRLEINVQSHVEHDARAAADLERAAKGDAEHVPAPHGGSEATSARVEAGPNTSAPPEPHGAGHAPFPEETDLPDPDKPLSRDDYPYLAAKRPHDVEAEAVPGTELPGDPATVAERPDTHPEFPLDQRPNFTGQVTPDYLEPGRTYYRAVGDTARPNGTYWTPDPPNGEPSLRRDLAVLNAWNGDHGIVSFTPNHRIPMWTGTVAPQWATESRNVSYLPGGGTQIWLPYRGIGSSDGEWRIARMPNEVSG